MLPAAYLLSFLCLMLNVSLFTRLKPPANFYWPLTNHAFDLLPPQVSPATLAAIYILALMN